MNFLAHFVLSCSNEAILTGNFMADFIPNREVKTLPPEVQEGVYIHRKIDSFMDTHPIVRQGSRRLHPYHHKYAPVVMDVFYDYLLAKNWAMFRNDTLTGFAKDCYEKLQRNMHVMQPPLQLQLTDMIAHNWLMSYTTEAGVASTFERIKRRVSKPEQLNHAVESLRRDYELLNKEFLQFFPQIIEFVQSEC